MNTILFKFLNVKKILKKILQECIELNWRVSDCEELLGVTQRMMGQISKAGEAFQALK